MIDLKNIHDVKALQSNLHVMFDGPPGKEGMRYLEQICGWYDFNEIQTEPILIGHGKRQVLANIKTLLKLKPEQVVALAQREGV